MIGTLGVIILTGACFRSMYIQWKQYQPNTPPQPTKEPQQAKTTEIQDETDTNKIHSIEWDAASREVIDIKLN